MNPQEKSKPLGPIHTKRKRLKRKLKRFLLKMSRQKYYRQNLQSLEERLMDTFEAKRIFYEGS